MGDFFIRCRARGARAAIGAIRISMTGCMNSMIGLSGGCDGGCAGHARIIGWKANIGGEPWGLCPRRRKSEDFQRLPQDIYEQKKDWLCERFCRTVFHM